MKADSAKHLLAPRKPVVSGVRANLRNVQVNQVYGGEYREGNFQLKYNWVLLYAHEIALLNDVFENQNLEKHCASQTA